MKYIARRKNIREEYTRKLREMGINPGKTIRRHVAARQEVMIARREKLAALEAWDVQRRNPALRAVLAVASRKHRAVTVAEVQATINATMYR